MTTTKRHLTIHPPGKCAICRRCSPPLTVMRLEMLARLARLNDAGVTATKASLLSATSTSGQSAQRRVIDEFIHAGIVHNIGAVVRGSYDLYLGDTGRQVLEVES